MDFLNVSILKYNLQFNKLKLFKLEKKIKIKIKKAEKNQKVEHVSYMLFLTLTKFSFSCLKFLFTNQLGRKKKFSNVFKYFLKNSKFLKQNKQNNN